MSGSVGVGLGERLSWTDEPEGDEPAYWHVNPGARRCWGGVYGKGIAKWACGGGVRGEESPASSAACRAAFSAAISASVGGGRER